MTSYSVARTVQVVVPSNNDTVQMTTGDTNDQVVVLNHTATIANLTYNISQNGDTIIGQNVKIWAAHEVTNLTFTGTGSPSIVNPPNTILANSAVILTKVGTDVWAGEQ